MTVASGLRRIVPWLGTLAAGFAIAYGAAWFWIGRGGDAATEAKVPNLVGMRVEQATQQLIAAGFGVRATDKLFHATAPEGTVLQQVPPPGTLTPRGTTVGLSVSAGQTSGTVPLVTGMTLDAAQSALQHAGFDTGEITEQQSPEPRGQVLFSTPSAGTTATLPASVALIISGGAHMVRVPELTGLSLADASRSAESLGLTVGVVVVDTLSLQAAGQVVQQIPAPGDVVAPGSAISLTVAKKIP